MIFQEFITCLPDASGGLKVDFTKKFETQNLC
jgi:hypothetical protein